MSKPGRKSAASLEVVRASGISTLERPEALPELTPDQSAEWYAVVNRMPAEWFPRETQGVLAQYCRHVVSSRRVSELIEGLISGDTESDNFVADYDRLLKMQERESRAVSALATRMRITQQSLVSKDKSKGGMKQKPPHMS